MSDGNRPGFVSDAMIPPPVSAPPPPPPPPAGDPHATPGPAPHPRTVLPNGPCAAAAQWERERTALVQCARALAFTHAGSPRPPASDAEGRAQWDAMRAAYVVLGVIDTRDLPGPQQPEQPATAALTDLEHQAMDVTTRLWELLCHIVGTSWTAGDDLRELAAHVHVIQNAILAQAAARAYPNRYRLLGGPAPVVPVEVAGDPRD